MDYHIPACTSSYEDYLQIIKKHASNDFKKPMLNNHIDIAMEINNIVRNKHFIWDWGCGTGLSTINLANSNPNLIVIGVDQSTHRLKKNPYYDTKQQISNWHNLYLIRADIVDLINCWSGPIAQKQFWLHPNPWPLKKHLKKRWPLHPSFKKIITMSRSTIMRSNWLSYAQLWKFSLLSYNLKPTISEFNGPAISAFEKKYLKNSVKCYQVAC